MARSTLKNSVAINLQLSFKSGDWRCVFIGQNRSLNIRSDKCVRVVCLSLQV